MTPRSLGPASPPLSAAGRAQLLELTWSVHRFRMSLMPAVSAVLTWLFSQSHDATLLVAWTSGWTALALSFPVLQRRLLRDRRALDPADFVARWEPRIEWMAVLHGAGLSVAVVLTLGQDDFPFMVILYALIAVVSAGNATHQNPAMSIYLRFFLSGWCVCTVLTPWAFPQHWPFILPLCLLCILALVRDASVAHRFVVERVQLEEHSRQLVAEVSVARDEARQALEDKNRFLSTASHDLRQPVQAMALLTEAIVLRNRDPAVTAPLDDLRSSMSMLQQMVNSLLSLSAIESGLLSNTPRTIDLAPVVLDTVAMFRGQADRRGLDLRARLPGSPAYVHADPTVLRQAVMNLVHNALRYTEQGRILIAVRPRQCRGPGTDAGHTEPRADGAQAGWLLQVWDTGVGIAQRDRDRILSPWYRAEHAWQVNSEGLGLGLAVVARCSERMGARLDFRSTLGRGSCFWLHLPAAPAPQDAGPASAPPAEHALTGGPRHRITLTGSCLIIDDDPAVLSGWMLLLKAWGLEVRSATCGEEAIALLDTGFKPQVVLCDQRLRAGESGIELLADLLNRCPQASGAMISGEHDSPELREAEQQGYLVLRKPVDPTQLLVLLSSWLVAGRVTAGTVTSPDA